MRYVLAWLLGAALMIAPPTHAASQRRLLIAHRGASAYAPEHTLASYQLALDQGADFVEQDLGVTRDGVLVCMHDPTLERTTNVEEVFPTRFTETGGRRQWFIADFTLAEIGQLDAGSWFGAQFAGARVPTFQQAIDLVRGKAGLFPELKAPGMYRDRGMDMVPIFVQVLRRNALDRKGADAHTPIIIQSFDATALVLVGRDLPTLDRTLLIDPEHAAEWTTGDGLARAAAIATGIGPAKTLIDADPTLVTRAHAHQLTVIPYTFRGASPGRFASVRDEMTHFLTILGVDGLFTDNPDQFPRAGGTR
jgi:glycerophosphoryl diester phosphodiesterase